MKNKNILYVVLILLVVLGIFFVLNSNKKDIEEDTNVLNANTADVTLKEYAMADVSIHNNASDCWTAINGSGYDVTSWISKHPGGPDKIIALCGIDGSQAFNKKHGGQRRPENELATFKIGVLK